MKNIKLILVFLGLILSSLVFVIMFYGILFGTVHSLGLAIVLLVVSFLAAPLFFCLLRGDGVLPTWKTYVMSLGICLAGVALMAIFIFVVIVLMSV